jgi:hypothetical protein
MKVLILSILVILNLAFTVGFAQNVSSEKRENKIKVIAYKEHPYDKYKNYAMLEYRKDFYVVNYNEYIKKTWRFTKIYHGKLFFTNVYTKDKVIESINVTTAPVGQRDTFDLSSSTRIISNRIQLSQALWFLSVIIDTPIILGPGENKFVYLNFVNKDEKKILTEIVKDSGFTISNINKFILFYTGKYRWKVADLFFEENKQLNTSKENIANWNYLKNSRNVKNLYLNNVSLQYAYNRIKEVSATEFDCSAVSIESNVSIFAKDVNTSELLRNLSAVSGVNLTVINNKLYFE